jgi:hypothetical protein
MSTFRSSFTAISPPPARRRPRGIDRAAVLILTSLCLGVATFGTGCGSSSSSTSSGSASSSGSSSSRQGHPSPAPPPLPGQQVSQIDRAFKTQLRKANIAFSTPTKLRVGDSGLVHLRLSFHVPVGVLRSQLGSGGTRTQARILASNTMEATLTGLAFKIQDISAATQLVGPNVTDWDWEIEPVKAGRLQLHLAMTAFIDVNGQQNDYGVRTFDRTLQVQSVPVAWYTTVSHFLTNNWIWLAGIIGFLGGAIKWLIRGRRQRLVSRARRERRDGGAPDHARSGASADPPSPTGTTDSEQPRQQTHA